jgi:hypothetical protein
LTKQIVSLIYQFNREHGNIVSDQAGKARKVWNMTKSEPAGWKMRKLFRAPSNRPSFDDALKPSAGEAIVQQIDSPHRLPATPIEHRLTSALRKVGVISFEKLVKSVAADLYAEELRKGAGVLDIGLFGSRLFNDDVVRELKAANGILWEIKSKP